MTRFSCFAVLVLFGATYASAASFATVSYPIGVNIDGGKYVPSSLYLTFTVKPYGVPLEQFATGDLDARERTFLAFMNSIRNKEYTRAEALLHEPVAAAETKAGPARIRVEPRTARQTVDLYNSAFAGLRDVTVVAQVLSGGDSLFIWEVSSPKGPMRRAFRVSSAGDKLAVSRVTMEQPLDLLILNNVMNNAAKDPRAYRPSTTVEKRVRWTFPGEKAASAAANPVVLQFDGQAVDLRILDDTHPAVGEVARLYRQAYVALRDRAIEQYLAFFTPRSRDRAQQWLTSITPEVFNAFHAAATRGGRIRYIVNADPVYLVFRTPIAPDEAASGGLTYDYLYRDASTGTLAFANFAQLDFLDDVLRDPALFNPAALLGGDATRDR